MILWSSYPASTYVKIDWFGAQYTAKILIFGNTHLTLGLSRCIVTLENPSRYLSRKTKSLFKWARAFLPECVFTFEAQSGLVSNGWLTPFPSGFGQISLVPPSCQKPYNIPKDILGSKYFIKHVYLPLPFEIANSYMVEKLRI